MGQALVSGTEIQPALYARVGYALLVHLSIVGYIGGLIAFLFGLFSLISALVELTENFHSSGLANLVIYSAIFFGGIGALVVARWIERIAAKHCIRLYLRRPTTSG